MGTETNTFKLWIKSHRNNTRNSDEGPFRFFDGASLVPHSWAKRLWEGSNPVRWDLCSPNCLQVDMFSYGMVIYELLSGNRPALGHHQRQIAKKLSKGIRPVLGNPEQVQFHSLQSLMTECWDNRPEKVSLLQQNGSLQGKLKAEKTCLFLRTRTNMNCHGQIISTFAGWRGAKKTRSSCRSLSRPSACVQKQLIPSH